MSIWSNLARIIPPSALALSLLGCSCGPLGLDGAGSGAVPGNGEESGGNGGTMGGSSGSPGGTGGRPFIPPPPPGEPLEPTADCVHPPVVENCNGEFCRIEPGCFIMGAPPGEFGKAAVNDDQVQVTLTRAFWIGRTEVTREQWANSGLPVPPLVQLNGDRECLEPDCPQSNATPYDMLRHANRRSELEGFPPCYEIDGSACTGSILTDDYECPRIQVTAPSPYECVGYRLPMEAEWEYAARAGTTTAFPTGAITVQLNTGDCFADAALEATGWYCKNSLNHVQRVAQKAPNAWGLHDMHGNVDEVVNDLYGPSGYLNGPFGPGEGPLVDPTGAANPPDDLTMAPERPFRVTRGGQHQSPASACTVSRRGSAPDDGSASNFGFRLARTIF